MVPSSLGKQWDLIIGELQWPGNWNIEVALSIDLQYFAVIWMIEENVIIYSILFEQWNLTIVEFQEDFRNFFNHAIIVVFASSFNHEMCNGYVPRWRKSTGWSGKNCLKESPFKTWWKVDDDKFFFQIISTYILNIRMVVHDWERREYKILLKFFSVVKYKLWIYNIICMF